MNRHSTDTKFFFCLLANIWLVGAVTSTGLQSAACLVASLLLSAVYLYLEFLE